MPWEIVALPTLLAAGALFLYWRRGRECWGVILALMLIAGMARPIFAQPRVDETHIVFYNNTPTPIKITGIVADEPDIRDYYINLRLRSESIEVGDTPHPVSGLVLIRAPR